MVSSRVVRNVFLILIFTIVIIVISMLFTEYLNISMYSVNLKLNAQRAVRNSCVLFSQETFKGSGGHGGLALTPIKDKNGTTVHQGYIYGSSAINDDEIYNRVYMSSDYIDFIEQLVLAGVGNEHNVLIDLNNYLQNNTTDIESFERGRKMCDEKFTSLNIGIPYIDTQMVSGIFQYNLISMLSGGAKDSSGNYVNVTNESTNGEYNAASNTNSVTSLGRYAVKYNGFYTSTDSMEVSARYRVYDLSSWADKGEFERISNVDIGSMSQNYVVVWTIFYKYDVRYEGITNIAFAMSNSWRNEVDNRGETSIFDTGARGFEDSPAGGEFSRSSGVGSSNVWAQFDSDATRDSNSSFMDIYDYIYYYVVS